MAMSSLLSTFSAVTAAADAIAEALWPCVWILRSSWSHSGSGLKPSRVPDRYLLSFCSESVFSHSRTYCATGKTEGSLWWSCWSRWNVSAIIEIKRLRSSTFVMMIQTIRTPCIRSSLPEYCTTLPTFTSPRDTYRSCREAFHRLSSSRFSSLSSFSGRGGPLLASTCTAPEKASSTMQYTTRKRSTSAINILKMVRMRTLKNLKGVIRFRRLDPRTTYTAAIRLSSVWVAQKLLAMGMQTKRGTRSRQKREERFLKMNILISSRLTSWLPSESRSRHLTLILT
mmetsp:Transcript_62112/g.152827  ORF Transcript_62112/g.152827 Transcript_62112/m.152827 type:complete len:284 (-) Transcript_62112:3106-3957(-)